MDFGRAVLLIVEIYVVALLVISAVTVAWVFDLFQQTDFRIAGIWFAVTGFGFLVFVTFVLIHLSRD